MASHFPYVSTGMWKQISFEYSSLSLHLTKSALLWTLIALCLSKHPSFYTKHHWHCRKWLFQEQREAWGTFLVEKSGPLVGKLGPATTLCFKKELASKRHITRTLKRLVCPWDKHRSSVTHCRTTSSSAWSMLNVCLPVLCWIIFSGNSQSCPGSWSKLYQ